MSRALIGLLFVFAGLIYGSMSVDAVYSRSLGWLVKNGWIAAPPGRKPGEDSLGRKPTILLYSLSLIIIGLFILWNRNA